MKNIVIIGAGWYGLHIYLFITQRYSNYNVLILESNSEIFNNSSYYNQNRLHLGYHYPRSNRTREICKNNYSKFIEKYNDVVDSIDKNFYCISIDSIIDYKTYLKIYDNVKEFDHTIISNNFLENIDGDFINTHEKIINSFKAKKYFKEKINKNCIKFDYKVNTINIKNNTVIINNDLECDILIDCTYNKLGLQLNYVYELTISLVYIKITNNDKFNSLTVMDGQFFSLFPRSISNNKYTLTHVKYTPLIKSENIKDIMDYNITSEKVLEVKKYMETEVIKYYKNFLKDFKYDSYFTSYKCKSKSNNDNRDCNILQKNNIISVNCGKITGIFEFENFIKEYLDKCEQ